MPANIDGGAQDPFLAMVVVYACPCHPASTLISGERPRAGTTVDIECRHDDVLYAYNLRFYFFWAVHLAYGALPQFYYPFFFVSNNAGASYVWQKCL